MSTIVFGGKMRGCWAEAKLGNGSAGEGARLSLPGGSTFGGYGGPDPFFITGVSFSQKEKYHIVQCFNDRNYTYAFGHDPLASLVEVNFAAYLVEDDGYTTGEGLKNLIAGYATSRLSEATEYATLTIGNTNLYGFVVGMTTGTQDPEHNLHNFTIILLVVEVQNGG